MRRNKIIQNLKYKEYVRRIEEHEKDRIFCKHDMIHFLDVCRLSEILWLKNKEAYLDKVNTELIYAAGLLHDVGRWQEYEEGVRHEIASARLSVEILKECGFEKQEIDEIILSIGNHRNKEVKEEFTLSGILYRADKMSRSCFCCKAEKECVWDISKKNMEIYY